VTRVDQSAYEQGLEWHTIQPGRPMENGYVESFNGTLRAECLDVHWFATLIEAKQVIESWRLEYMTVVLTDLWENERRVSSLVRSL